jgi:hypothetical protein
MPPVRIAGNLRPPNNQRLKTTRILPAALFLPSFATADPLPVGALNCARAETDRAMRIGADDGSFGKLRHRREPADCLATLESTAGLDGPWLGDP